MRNTLCICLNKKTASFLPRRPSTRGQSRRGQRACRRGRRLIQPFGARHLPDPLGVVTRPLKGLSLSLGTVVFGLAGERPAWRAWPHRHGRWGECCGNGEGGRELAGWRPAKGAVGGECAGDDCRQGIIYLGVGTHWRETGANL